MNPQYGHLPNFPSPPMNYNGNQVPQANLSNQMAGMSLNNDVKAPPTQFGAPPVPQESLGNFPPQSRQLNKPLAPNAGANMPQQQPIGNFTPQSGQLNRPLAANAGANIAASPMGHINPQMNPQINPLMNSRPIPSNNSMQTGASIPQQNGAPQTMNGPSQPFNGPTNQFATQQMPMSAPSPMNSQLPSMPQQNRPPSANPNIGAPPLPGQVQNQNQISTIGSEIANVQPTQIPSSQQPPMQRYPAQSQMPQYPQPPMNQVPVPNQPMVGLPPPSLGQNRPPMQQYSQQPMPPQPGNYPQNYPQQPNMPPQPNQVNRICAQPGQHPQGGALYGAGNQYPPGMAAPPQRKLDPDQMPNPIQVMDENQRSVNGQFVTNEIGGVPPLVTTKFVTSDQGNSGPRFIRSTMYSVPATPDMIKQTSVPFSLIISPFAKAVEGEMIPPIVDFGELGPIRCVRCKAYMSPNMQFVDAGRRFRCALCKATTDVPQEYFQHLDHAGQRVDKYERPELVLGTYEFIATKEYCRENRPSKPPAFIFVIDVSYNNIKSGLVHMLCHEMKNILKNLPIDQGQSRSQMKVGFITYNNTVHFYNCKENLAQPQMMVVGDIHEMFMPLLDGFFVDPEESSTVIDALMEQIPIMFGETRETETILLPAIQAGLEAIKASECSGKLLVFHSSLPVSDAPGRVQNREDRKLLGTENEKKILSPQNNTYNNLGQDCVLAGCSVDLFIFNNSYIDLATIGQVARLTGGEIYKYTYFQADIDGPRVISDLIKNISRPIAFDAVMRVRTSAGIRPTDFFGHFFMSNTTDMDLASITSEKAIGIEIKHDDKLPPEENVYIQVALLYTSCSGQRRIRILNLALKTCVQMADLFRCCDLDAMILYFAKQIMFKLLDSTPRAIREALEMRCAQILACYRKNCASPTSAGQLILPECMKLLPLYISCMMKNDAISGGSDMSCDDRSYVMQFVSIMDLSTSVFYFYPRLIPIHDVNPNDDDIPAPIRCSIEKLADDGAYILENGVHLIIWLGLSLAPEFTQAVFSAQCSQLVDTDRPGIPDLDNPLSKRVRGIIDAIQAERPRCMRVTIVRSRDKLENVMRHYLIEDRSGNGAASYVDYLCHLHKEIRALLS